MIRALPLGFVAALAATSALAAPENYTIDAGHSQIVFNYNHLGYGPNFGMFGGFTGEIVFDAEDPAASSVNVTFPINTLITGFQARYDHLMTADFFNAEVNPDVTFTSTAIEVTGDNTANITGDLTINGVTQSVVLAATLNQAGEHPMEKKAWIGVTGTTTLSRTAFNLGAFTPYISDEVPVTIQIEAGKAE